MKSRKSQIPIRIPILYFAFSVIYILVSDTLVNLLFPDPILAARVQTYKGWGFVVITSILLLIVLYREFQVHDKYLQRIGVIQTALDESSTRFRVLFESSPIGIAVTNGSKIVYANAEFAAMFGYSSVVEMEGKPLLNFIVHESRESFQQQFSFATRDLLNSVHLEVQGLRKDGSEISLMIQSGKVRTGFYREVVSFFVDLTHQKKTEQDLVFQVEKLNSLRNIDLAINFSLDLKLVLDTILNEVTRLLKVDAASIYLLRKDSQILEFAAGKGFISNNFSKLRILLTEDPAGETILTRKIHVIPDLRIDPAFLNSKGIEEERFISAILIPLVAKGVVIGLMEVFQRSPLEPDSVWLDFLDTLAGQTAIAIDNSYVYEDLQRSNTEMIRAYEETIEGWSNAMDMRDHETEGHTQRVTSMTMQLARKMDFSPTELVHIRRGCLLHDIGKMGIPDHILLKEGELTSEERDVMDRHPELAFELLSSIAYLRQAMEIPYCHHERWDGSGYPRGLRGEMIPLEARIFSVVDVFDALRSDRPYRKSLSEEDTLRFISEHSGSHFDPKVVKIFLDQIRNQRETFLKDYYQS